LIRHLPCVEPPPSRGYSGRVVTSPRFLATQPSSVPGGLPIQTGTSREASWTRAVALVVATGAGAGYSPFASGTAGAAVGALLFWPLAALSLPVYAVTLVGATALAIWSADVMTRHWATEDDGRIVADEIAGQLVTLAPLVALGLERSVAWIVTGFVVFRLYDIWKPGPVRWLEENVPGGAGVVLDDVLAGVIGALTLALLIWVVPMVVGK
jgi:phosphatidylglycerophosphatase A